MSLVSQFGSTSCRRPTLAELQTIVGLSTVGSVMYTETDNQTAAFIDIPKLADNGSRLICKSSGVGMIVAPRSTEVSRTWYCRNDARLAAQLVTQTCCTQWFVPTKSQLQNPGYCCRSFWGPSPCFSSTRYWSSTEGGAPSACNVNFNGGSAYDNNKTITSCVRAFRCVTY